MLNTDFLHFWDLLVVMTEKEFKTRYKHTIFGFLWVIVNPLIQMVVIAFVFQLFLKEPISHYFHYLFAGLLTWNFFTVSLTKTAPSVINERSLIKKAKFPHLVIPFSIILSNAINLLIALFFLALASAFTGLLTVTRLPHFLIGFILLLGFTSGLSLLTSALNVRFRDVNFLVQAFLIIWFYVTPIVYSISVIPYRLMWLWRINPMTSIVQLFQYVFADAPAPGLGMMTSNIITILAVVFLGFFVFQKENKNFDDWV